MNAMIVQSHEFLYRDMGKRLLLYRYLLYTLLIAFVLSGCGSKTLLQDSYAVKQKEERATQLQPRVYRNARFEYRIAAHDRVQVTVYNHPELSTGSTSPDGILVDSSGRVHLPLVNTVHIGGLTQPRAARKIQALYGHYLKKSNVQLEVRNKRAFVAGEVKTPGVIKLPNEQTALLQAITEVGGFTDHANKEKIVIIRKSGRGSKVEIVDLTNLTSLSHASMMIRPNDIIYVTPSNMKTVALPAAAIFKLVADALLPFVRYQDLSN
jgi:polysaccharide export outer membrane protein